MQKHPFLSPEWVVAARSIREEYKGRSTVAVPPFKMNQVVTAVPFGEGTIDAHIDTTDGDLYMELGHIADAEVKVTIPYAVAKALFVFADAQAAMQAFMSGHIKVDGDLTKLMQLQAAGAATDPVALEIAERLRAITSD